MKNLITKQAEFQKTFGRPSKDKPVLISPEDAVFRYHLIGEEAQEYLEAAVLQKDVVEVADALGDLLYVVFGTINEHGMQHLITDVFNEIHRSNMSKLFTADDGTLYFKNNENGKTIKPPTYSPPDLTSILFPEINGEGIQD